MELIAFWVLLALLVGYGAAQKGRNGFGWFLVALLLSPLIGGLFVLFMQSNTVPQVENRPRWMLPPPVPDDHVAALRSLADLRDRGALTEDEFQSKKAELLARV